MKPRLRATCISNDRLWLSWMPHERARAIGWSSQSRRRFCSKRACPVSWIVPMRLRVKSSTE